MASLTVYSGAGDGFVRIDDATSSWATVRSAANGDTVDYAATVSEATSRKTTTPSWGNYRSFLPFDTSSLPDDAIIDSAVLSIYITILRQAEPSFNIHCVETSQADTASLVLADYDNITFTDLGFIHDSSIVLNTYNDITLNATGLTKISKTGFTKIGIITSFDLNNTEPAQSNNQAGYRGIQFSNSEQTGTSQDPKLVIDYTIATTTSTTTSTSTSSTSSSTTKTDTTTTTSTTTTSTSSTSSSTSSTSSSTSSTSTSTSSTSSSTTSTSSSTTMPFSLAVDNV